MLDRERRDLDVRDVVASQARRPGEVLGNRSVSGTGHDQPDSRLLEIRRRHVPALLDRDGVLPEHARTRNETEERVDDRPAERNRPLALREALLEPFARAVVLRSVRKRRIDEQVRVDECHVMPRWARRSSSSAASSAETSDTSMIGRPGSSGSTGGTVGGATRALRRRSRLTAARNDSPVRALSISAATSSSSVIVVRMMLTR